VESKLLRNLTVLGVPGVTLGVFYLLLRGFGFQFSTVGPTASAIVVVIFLLVVGGVTSFALHRWAPPRPGPPVTPTELALTSELLRAKAFQISWLIMTLLSKSARHPEAVQHQIDVHAQDIGLDLPESWQSRIQSDDGGEVVMSLVESLGGQLVARRPDLAPYFEAGFNLVLSASRNDSRALGDALEKLEVPASLKTPQTDMLKWANAVHDHFEKQLRSAAS